MKISWNPLRCGGGWPSVPVALMGNLLLISLVLTRPYSLPAALAALAVGAVAACFRRTWGPPAIWTALLALAVLLYTLGTPFAPYFLFSTASLVALARWPTSPMLTIYDGDCAFCSLAKKWIERFDLYRILYWQPYQSGIGEPYGITELDASRRLYLINGDKIYSGFSSFKMMVLCNPIPYMIVFLMLALGTSGFRNITVAVLLFLFSPLFQPAGDALYALVARHRRTLVAGSSCSIE